MQAVWRIDFKGTLSTSCFPNKQGLELGECLLPHWCLLLQSPTKLQIVGISLYQAQQRSQTVVYLVADIMFPNGIHLLVLEAAG